MSASNGRCHGAAASSSLMTPSFIGSLTRTTRHRCFATSEVLSGCCCGGVVVVVVVVDDDLLVAAAGGGDDN
jgi:hypothetical protein